jgi:hypothetical protein
MSPIPDDPKVYHITHVSNLPDVVRAGCLWSDAKRLELGVPCRVVGMSTIKERRLGIPVPPHPGTTVGQYAPFYFCPRSIMLFILHRANHPDLEYRGGQAGIVHLVADLRGTVRWADEQMCAWAFTSANAASKLASFHSDLGELGVIDWQAVANPDFRDARVKERKQAEFLLYESLPWHLVERIGVREAATRTAVELAMRDSTHRPPVSVEPNWYY